MLWLKWVWFLIPYSFKKLRIRCSSLRLHPGRRRKNIPTIIWGIWLVRTRPHAEYMRTIYCYIPSGFNKFSYSTAYLSKNNRSWSGIKLFTLWVEVVMIWICSACSVPVCAISPHDYMYMTIIRLSYIDFYK